MRHHNTKAIAEYWESLKDEGQAPARDDLSPHELSKLLSNVFILQRHDAEHATFRLAGTSLCELYQRELRDQNFLSLWQGADRIHMEALMAAAAVASSPATALIAGETIEGRKLKSELFLAPLAGPDGAVDRYLGLYQPLGELKELGGRPIIRQYPIALYPPNAHVHAMQNTRAPLSSVTAAPRRERPRLRVVADNTGAAGAPAQDAQSA